MKRLLVVLKAESQPSEDQTQWVTTGKTKPVKKTE
jgi:hypothetical protein